MFGKHISAYPYRVLSPYLLSFGLSATNYQESSRETWKTSEGVLAELERWPNLPAYIEIEGHSVEAIRVAADKLGLD